VYLEQYYNPPQQIETHCNSVLLNYGQSETSMLNDLQYDGILEIIFGEKIHYGPLLGGRHRCTFKTTLNNDIVSISGAQYETDACYETESCVYVIEAKMGKNITNFNMRQLYYPYRSVYDTISGKKKIYGMFIYKDKLKIIHIYKYLWKNPLIMMDVECVDYYSYIYKN
jgi:hypothetical protein